MSHSARSPNPSSTTYVAPKGGKPRPPLPVTQANPCLISAARGHTPAVKYQLIVREGQEIIVGRVKVQTPGDGHAFILRRFDTGAISLTTMFRAAFPTATEEAERAETQWVRASYDCSGANGNGAGAGTGAALRLAGAWVPPDVAISLAGQYALAAIIPALADAHPDPSQEYRRSSRHYRNAQSSPQQPSQAPAPPQPAMIASKVNGAAATLPTPSPPSLPNPSKRRKEASPSPVGRTGRTASPAASAVEPAPVMKAAASAPIAGATSAPRSTRSQAPRNKGAKVNGKVIVEVKEEIVTTAVTAAPPSIVVEDEDAPEVPGPDMHEDIAEQKALIEKLKEERAERVKENEGTGDMDVADEKPAKRTLDEVEAPPGFNPLKAEETEESKEARMVKSNRRLSMRNLPPQQKSAAWGVAMFALGFAAVATIPSFIF